MSSLLYIFFFSYSTYFLYKTIFGSIENIYSYSSIFLLNLLGYNINNDNLENFPSKMIIVGTHTSIYDFFIGALYYYAYLHKNYTTYLFMKNDFEKICTPILKLIDKKFKIIKVESKNNGLTQEIINKLNNKDNYIIFIAPEGTRNCVENIRKGYWYISKGLNAQISFLGIDFYNKKIDLGKNRNPESLWENELKWFINECKKIITLSPERCFWTKDFYQTPEILEQIK